MELKRDIYIELLDWKKRHTGKVLELSGARQVGKTFILESAKYFGDPLENEVFRKILGAVAITLIYHTRSDMRINQ